jgi:anti-sigma factor RsiW
MNQSDESFSRHRHAWELIPWVVNGRASAAEKRTVDEHLADCADCREELALQSRLYTAMRSGPDAAPADPQPALQRLWQRIDAATPVPQRRTTSLPLARGLLAAVLIEAVGIAALSAVLWSHEAARAQAPLYQTLSAPAEGAPRASIRAVLAPTLSLGEFEALLARTHLQIVGGPGDGGVYSLAPRAGAGTQADAVAQLRSHPGVRFAEPVDTARVP